MTLSNKYFEGKYGCRYGHWHDTEHDVNMCENPDYERGYDLAGNKIWIHKSHLNITAQSNPAMPGFNASLARINRAREIMRRINVATSDAEKAKLIKTLTSQDKEDLHFAKMIIDKKKKEIAKIKKYETTIKKAKDLQVKYAKDRLNKKIKKR